MFKSVFITAISLTLTIDSLQGSVEYDLGDATTLQLSVDQDSKNASLRSAIEIGNLVAVKALVAYGADVNASIKNSEGAKICPVLLALREPEILEFLIAAGADINVNVGQRSTPLHIAAQCQDAYEALCLLIKNGANVDAVDLYGRTPLHRCFFFHIKQNALALMEYGANIHVCDHDGWTPLYRGCQRPDIDILRRFVELGASLDEFFPDGKNVLHWVCYTNNLDKLEKMDLLRFLIEEKNMDVNQQGKWDNGTMGSYTPFMLAIGSSGFEDEDFEVLEYLVERGANFNAKLFYVLHDGRRNVLYNSVLDWAIEGCPRHVVQWLQETATRGLN